MLYGSVKKGSGEWGVGEVFSPPTPPTPLSPLTPPTSPTPHSLLPTPSLIT